MAPSPFLRSRSAPSMGAVDLAYHRATGGSPLATGFLVRFRGSPPSLDAVRARVAERAPGLPVLHHRVAAGRPAVEYVERIAAEDHVREADVPDDGDGSAAGRLMLTRPLPGGGRPPWDVWLIRGGGDGYTLCYRGDHTLQDGTGAAHTTRALLEDRPEPTGGPPAYRRSWPTPRGLGEALGDVLSALRPPGDPLPAPFVARQAGPAQGGGGMCVADAPLDRLRAVGRAWGGTVNDVYLAALAFAMRTWRAKETGGPPLPLPAVVPMSVRGPGEEYLPGNRMAMARLRLPCDAESPADALARMTARARAVRRTRRRDATRLLLAASPRSFGARVGVRMVNGRRVIGAVSGMNFGGPLVHEGATAVSAAMFTGLAAGMPCYTSLTGCHGTARLTVVHDLALPGADTLGDLWLAALGELEGTRGPGR